MGERGVFASVRGDGKPAALAREGCIVLRAPMPLVFRLRQQVKRLACTAVRPWLGGVGCILVFHRIAPAVELARLPDNRALEITPDALRAILGWVRCRGLEVIGMDDVSERIARPRGRKFIAFTFDDGYRDNLEVALPIFREFGFPFTVNLTTGYLDRSASLWWYSFEDILAHRSSLVVDWPSARRDWRWGSPNEAEAVFLELAAWVRSQGRADREELVDAICAAGGVDPIERTRGLIMDWDEARALASDPLVTIGNHTAGHHTLRNLDDAELRAELVEASSELERKLGRRIVHLAYPFGGRSAVRGREFTVTRECGFATAVTTRGGNLFPAHASHLLALPRFSMSGNYDSIELIERLESGLPSTCANGWRRVVVD